MQIYTPIVNHKFSEVVVPIDQPLASRGIQK